MDAQAHTIAAWFDQRAGSYHDDSGRGLWGRVREREARHVFGMLPDVRGTEVLDMGCGAGFYAQRTLSRGAALVVAVDMSTAMVDALPHPIQGHVGDAAQLDLGRTFDRVLLAGMLEFTPDPAAVLANARRHTRPDGALVLLVPKRGLLGLAYQRMYARRQIPVHLFTAPHIRRLATSTGWSVSELSTPHSYALVALLTPQSTP